MDDWVCGPYFDRGSAARSNISMRCEILKAIHSVAISLFNTLVSHVLDFRKLSSASISRLSQGQKFSLNTAMMVHMLGT